MGGYIGVGTRGGRVGYSPPKNLLPEHTRNEVLYDSYTDE